MKAGMMLSISLMILFFNSLFHHTVSLSELQGQCKQVFLQWTWVQSAEQQTEKTRINISFLK
jgi:hypothetical protein